MVSAILARRAVPLARSNLNMGARRFAHVENTHGSRSVVTNVTIADILIHPLTRPTCHAAFLSETSLPFGQGPKNKVPIAIGLVTFLATGFSLPFLAARFQYKKANS
ncbi:hypothetical protein IE81DRAFT_344661 [Ceraceosorus guamensis]|uniref:Uncharacterized protein n=1 Tax=Ceraceosorus guamensis TaxID=1522189 RepID=A0A316WCT4_9BASI|nr:hypothetical protein IE81DRAFT_344661 [Ceraceosorus guamensis]PWN45345.1 hypothetical protein IE81DRAFT_344661 [Ceraceosorus guamensis]